MGHEWTDRGVARLNLIHHKCATSTSLSSQWYLHLTEGLDFKFGRLAVHSAIIRILLLPTAGHYRMTAHVTNRGRFTDPPIRQLKSRSWERSVGWGKVCAIFGACVWCWALDMSAAAVEVQPGATTEGSCYTWCTGCLALRARNVKQHFVRPERLWFTRTVPT